ncbi:hypothetical protein EDD93_0878 [Streptomyces sp. 840.1]|uniref:hypothetical protein n=1 Tax=Streptomyces sp. 840.1 TaxID=2485152 RepID=UPI000F467109|nr:hypothetical protein [Streptomyces sp. 840.1]ROQ66472.1 hypothetical protein EDD93_0878 [Streptomyces sp. 840.1]
MSGAGRKEDEVRRMLEGPHPQVPADLAERAAELGGRVLRRRRALRRLGLLALIAAVAVFTVWAVTVQPWQAPPAETTPPLGGW